MNVDADITVIAPTDENEDVKTEEIEKRIEESEMGIIAEGDYDVEEIYISNRTGNLEITGTIEGFFVGLTIPVKGKAIEELTKDLVETQKLDLIEPQSGLHLDLDDFEETMKVTPNKDGRATIGREYSEKSLKLVVMEE